MYRRRDSSTLWALLIIAGICVMCFAPFCTGVGPNYSRGQRTGTVVKFSQKGAINKSWEGTLHLGATAVAAGTTTWDFSVEDPGVVRQVQEAFEQARPVKVLYRQYMVSPWTISTTYVVEQVRPVLEADEPKKDPT